MKGLATLSLALLAACTGLGRMPSVVVEMYDLAKPDGMIEIEAERNGAILEIEADIPVADLPEQVRNAAMNKLPGGQITGAEYEMIGKSRSYEVKMSKDGRDYEFVYDVAANLLESEKELKRHEAPKGVVEAALLSIPNSQFKSVELIHAGGKEVYHVKCVRAGASYKVVLTPDGTITRRVREQRAELEIPLND